MLEVRTASRITGRFRDLQGLRQVAGGVAMLLLAGWTLIFPLAAADIRKAPIGQTLLSAALLIILLALLVVSVRWLSAWYRARYGEVEHTAQQRRLWLILGVSGFLAFMVPFEVEVLAMERGQPWTINLLVIGLAVWIFGYWLYLGSSFRHYLVMAIIGFALGIASVSGFPPATFVWQVREAVLYLGAASIVGGLIDHRILARALALPVDGLGSQP